MKKYQRKHLLLQSVAWQYQHIVKPFLFLFNPVFVHTVITSFGSMLGSNKLMRTFLKHLLVVKHPAIEQTVMGIRFENPVGLSAGFDYQARLTQMLPSLGFGFGTVGTITNHPYAGNKAPLLGRLPKSRSLMVNKGFKNDGAAKTIQRPTNLDFAIPIGISIGRTNRTTMTQQESVDDIIHSFQLFEASTINHAYYELNISCPNLHGTVSFYPPENLEQLLSAIDKLKLKKPLLIKMPIEKTNEEVLEMLTIIARHSPAGIIIGNLQKDRTDKTLDPKEVAKFSVGNFSGKPTFQRSNELISLTYKHFSKRFIIIGCGGIFNARDAYEKIKRGATLLQMITGMIFMGPQVIAEIHYGLIDLLKKDGFTHISQAIGSKNSTTR